METIAAPIRKLRVGFIWILLLFDFIGCCCPFSVLLTEQIPLAFGMPRLGRIKESSATIVYAG
jgi:hypothetical protein